MRLLQSVDNTVLNSLYEQISLFTFQSFKVLESLLSRKLRLLSRRLGCVAFITSVEHRLLRYRIVLVVLKCLFEYFQFYAKFSHDYSYYVVQGFPVSQMLIADELLICGPVFFYVKLAPFAIELLTQLFIEALMARIDDLSDLDKLLELNYGDTIFFDHFYVA